jgi:hypothetical protein
MTEDEIMARAIHAKKQRLVKRDRSQRHVDLVDADDVCVQAAAIALRNLTIPLSEILPEDPDEREAWKFYEDTAVIPRTYALRHNSTFFRTILAAIKRGRALAGEGE